MRPQLLFVPEDLAPAGGTFALYVASAVDDDPGDVEEELRAAAEHLGFPAGTVGSVPALVASGGRLVARDLPARLVPILPAVQRLAQLPPADDWPRWARPAPAVLAWSVAAKLGLELVAAGHLLPSFRPTPTPGEGRARWRIAAPGDARPTKLAEAFPPGAHALRHPAGEPWHPADLLAAFLDALADACARGGRRPVIDPRRRGPQRPWSAMWPDALTGSDPTVTGLRVPADELAASIDDWSAPLVGSVDSVLARLALRLEAPAADTGDGTPLPGSRAGSWKLSWSLEAADDPTQRVPADEVWKAAGRAVQLGARRVAEPEVLLVRGLATAARLFPPVDRALSEARPTEVDLTAAEVADLLSDGVDALLAAGISVQLPPGLGSGERHRLRLRARIGRGTTAAEPGTALGLGSLTDLRYEVTVGATVLTDEEFAHLVALDEPLVRWRGTWISVERSEVARIEALAGSSASLDLTEALAAALAGQQHVDDLGWVEAVAEGGLGELVERLKQVDGPGPARIVGIHGELRTYQERGVAWLQQLSELGLGAVLADQMGLGKTLQAIALLTSRVQDRPHLVVCPTSVVGNWERELARFAPDLEVVRHHGSERAVTHRAFRPGQVVVTSYALLRRDLGLLEALDWDVTVFDEAQQIKNPASKGSRAARSLQARTRIAMTGTPVENRLLDLWSIVDLTNPGLLGPQRKFSERFAIPIERWHDEGAATRLRRLVAPFVLRRRKDDPDVSVDLPPKQEVTVDCSLTSEQAALYRTAVERAFAGEGLGATAFERRGRILALITALKQICNHPVQYHRDGGPLQRRSGKLTRATDILAELVDGGDRALVFTQFREMGHLLQRHLAPALGLDDVPFLHGGVPLAARDEMVRRFQDDDDAPPLLLVSLRAGGTGLNLTRASHVVHYDRWWNPAVEDQATDRAHRIGQSQTVTVHTLVTNGTLEERIADLLERKRALADTVVGGGETWLTELGDDELRDLLELSSPEVDDDDDADLVPPGPPQLVAIDGGRR